MYLLLTGPRLGTGAPVLPKAEFLVLETKPSLSGEIATHLTLCNTELWVLPPFSGYSPSSRVAHMDLLQLLAFLFVLLLSGTGITGTLRTSLDPSLEICILRG